MKTKIKINRGVARKVLEIVDAGLSNGAGRPVPGEMCIEAAVCFALGLPHGDNPPCVGRVVRQFKISLNDCSWPSDLARAKGMRKLAVAQLGSDTIDQVQFSTCLAMKVCKVFLPEVIREFFKVENAEILAKTSENAATLEECKNAAHAAHAAAHAAHAATSAARAASYAAHAASYAASAASYAAASAARAASYAASYASYAAKNNQWLEKMADIGLECLIELNSPGCKWLDLCDAEGGI